MKMTQKHSITQIILSRALITDKVACIALTTNNIHVPLIISPSPYTEVIFISKTALIFQFHQFHFYKSSEKKIIQVSAVTEESSNN